MLAEGQSVGNYRILSKIGTGGMGAVYLAEHPLIGKKVALKVIHRELAGNKEVIQRFFQEAKAVNKIGHENIIEVHDFGQSDDGDHFYIMEYIEGRTLASVLARERTVEITRGLHIAAQIASALAAAHAAGVIHRDLKPDNIMLVSRLGDPDFVKVLDFGLAKFLQTGSLQLTAAGVVLGTPQYMSPEACESKKDIDHRTDIYAIGILLFQMLCGELPFDGQSMGEVLIKQVMEPPPAPRGLNAAVPPAVEQIILRCLAKQPDRRFATMIALRDALQNPDAYLSTSPPIMPARSVPPGSAPVDARTLIANIEQSKPAAGPKLPLAAGAPTVLGKASAAQPAITGNARPAADNPTVMAPGLAPPVPAQNNTMVIATPPGHKSRPPRRLWPVVMVIVLLGALVGGGVVIAVRDRSAATATDAATATATGPATAADAATGTATGSATDAATGTATDAATAIATATADARPRPADAATVVRARADAASGTGIVIVPTTVKVTLETVPPGAEIRGARGKLLGKTPKTLELPVEKGPLTVELRLKGYRPIAKKIDVTDDLTIRETLVKKRKPREVGGQGSGDGLIDPDDL